MEDRISKIPDDILISILSRLTIEEAVRTCILSRRWRYLWTFFNGCLNFDDLLRKRFLEMCLNFCRGFDANHISKRRNQIDQIRNKLVYGIDRVLGSLKCQTVQELRICLDVCSNCDVDSWLQFAIEKKVQRLEFDFSSVLYDCRGNVDKQLYPFPSHFDIQSSFGSLTALRLTYVDVKEEALKSLLSYSPMLEVLSLKRIKCLASLTVSGPSLKLKCLELDYLPDLKDLEIDAANLISFLYSGREINVLFKHVPSLSEISIEGNFCKFFLYKLCQFSSFLSQLRTLKLHSTISAVPETVLCSIPQLPNLKHLEMMITIYDEDSLFSCAALLKVSPSLYKFTVKLLCAARSSQPVQNIKNHPYLSLRDLSLRVVELIGFGGLTSDVDFMAYLLETSKLVEKIIIDPCRPLYLGSPKELLIRNSKEYQSTRKRAVEFAAKFPQLEFVIL